EHLVVARVGRGVRVIAGEAGGRRLVSPPGDRVRPTADRVKESVFSALRPERLTAARVLDLYAGSGALAIEAVSRGASAAVLVDRDRNAVAAITRNLEALDFTGRARVVAADIAGFLGGPPPAEAPFDLVFLDPPYDLAATALDDVLGALADPRWTTTETVPVVE